MPMANAMVTISDAPNMGQVTAPSTNLSGSASTMYREWAIGMCEKKTPIRMHLTCLRSMASSTVRML